MSSKRFQVSRQYNGLEEAVNPVLEQSDSEYDFAIIPPAPSVVTDEEEGADENLVSAVLPREVPENIEVFKPAEDIVQSDEGDSSDDEPLSIKAKKMRKDQPKQPVWRKCAPIYISTTPEKSDVLDRQEKLKEQLQDLTPVQIFEKLFDEDVISLIMSNTSLYSYQNNRHNFQIDSVDLKKNWGY